MNKSKQAAPEKYKDIDFKPPKSVADQAKKGLEYRQKASDSNKGGLTSEEAGEQGIGSGVQRATNLKNRDTLSPETVRQMVAFFARHEKNKSIAEEHKGEPWNDKGYVAWCLKGDSDILLSDGSWLPISHIVDNQMEVEVWSFNETTHSFEPKRVTGWSKAPSTLGDYFIVGKHKTMRQGLSDRTFLAATAEHPFFVDGEWVEAKDMDGRHLSVVDEGLDFISEQVLLGTLLGDATIWKSSPCAGTLRMSHGAPQRAYLEEKSRLLAPLIGGSYDVRQKGGFGAGKVACRAYTRSTLYLSEIRSRFYGEDGVKKVTPDLLASLGDVAMAFWLMDDGKLKFSERDGHSSWILHTEGFDVESVENIVRFLNERYGVDARAVPRENTKGSVVYFTSEGTRKMMSRLAPFFHPSMRYKVLPDYRDVPYVLASHEPQSVLVLCQQPVTRFGLASEEYASKAARKPYKWAWRYNLEVEGNHNFIANGILVHNCLWGGDAGKAWAEKVVKQMDAADERAKKAAAYRHLMAKSDKVALEVYVDSRGMARDDEGNRWQTRGYPEGTYFGAEARRLVRMDSGGGRRYPQRAPKQMAVEFPYGSPNHKEWQERIAKTFLAAWLMGDRKGAGFLKDNLYTSGFTEKQLNWFESLERRYSRLTRQLPDNLHLMFYGKTPGAEKLSGSVLEKLRAKGWVSQGHRPTWVFGGAKKGAPGQGPSSNPHTRKQQLEALDLLLAKKPGDRFLRSLADQVRRGRRLSEKQTKALRRNFYQVGLREQAGLFKAAAKKLPTTGDGTSVGLFIPLPDELAVQFPSKTEDPSPAHTTLLIVGEVPEDRREDFARIVQDVCDGIHGPVKARLAGVDHFVHPGADRRVFYSPIRFSQDVAELRDRLWVNLEDAGFDIKDRFPMAYNPHVTLGYIPDAHDGQWRGSIPTGMWEFNGIEAWGLPDVLTFEFRGRVLRNPTPAELRRTATRKAYKVFGR